MVQTISSSKIPFSPIQPKKLTLIRTSLFQEKKYSHSRPKFNHFSPVAGYGIPVSEKSYFFKKQCFFHNFSSHAPPLVSAKMSAKKHMTCDQYHYDLFHNNNVVNHYDNVSSQSNNVFTQSDYVLPQSENVLLQSDNVLPQSDNVLPQSDNALRQSDYVVT
jgi:hypothetical protein